MMLMMGGGCHSNVSVVLCGLCGCVGVGVVINLICLVARGVSSLDGLAWLCGRLWHIL